MPYADPKRQSEYNKRYLKKHYRDNKQYYFDKKNRRIKEAIAFVNQIKEGKVCADCMTPYPPYVMDFDHREGKMKDRCISLMVRMGVSHERMLEEIKKCDLVCANCHRERTHQRLRNGVIGNTGDFESLESRFEP